MAAARAKLLTPAVLNSLPDDLANELLYQQQHYYRHYAPNAQRPKSVEIAKLWSERLPQSFEAAATYLSWALDFGIVDQYKPAAERLLKLSSPTNNLDPARRMMQVAGHFKDANLGRQVWDWTKKQYDKHGYDIGYATYFGDVLTQLELKAEANDCWTRGVNGNPESTECRECALRVLATLPEDQKPRFLDERLARDSAMRFSYAIFRADLMLKAGDVAGADKLLREAAERQRDRAFGANYIEYDHGTVVTWVHNTRADMKMDAATKIRIFTLVRDLNLPRASMIAIPALAELPESETAKLPAMKRLLVLADATQRAYGDTYDFDLLMNFTQAAMARKDYLPAATLLSGMLANCPNIDPGRKKSGRDLLTQAYTRLGAAGGAVIDENSPIAPLLQAALQLRLGDPKLAFDTYLAHQQLFDEHRAEVPIDLLAFVVDHHMAAGGDENFNRVEDILRSWLIKNSEAKDIDAVDKARVQLLLARNYFRSKRYDLARAEYTTLLNKYAKTPQATEAEFGIGETFMEQKVYDQAEQTFERLANSRERDIIIRAEFLRGVLANRRGDRDEARQIFRSVLERVPNIELANQTLYNLSEVYGAEQRYVDQLELLRTVGRLGRASKRYHAPGEPLSIVVQDSDLGVSRGHSRIPVLVTTEPGGDQETIYLLSGGAGKGLFRADLETRLGAAAPNDRVLQLTGKDVIRVDYPPEFKKEFKDAPLPDAEIRIAAEGRLEMASSKIVDANEETFSQRLERETRTEDGEEELRRGLIRPKDQVKPGNLIYLRVKDADRDTSDQPDTIAVKLTASSGDQVQAVLTETGPHTGIFEGTAKTSELPAGALASNTAIDHSPLMAIDKNRDSSWLSEPDGVTPKFLSIDMKDLKHTDRVTVWTPQADSNAPVRMTLEGSDDGRLWFRLAATQADPPTESVAGPFGQMTTRIYEGTNAYRFDKWQQVVALTKNTSPTTTGKTADLFWTRNPDENPKEAKGVAIVWSGKLVQTKTGAARIHVSGNLTAIMVDGRLELPLGPGNRAADLFLDAGTHDLTIFSAVAPQTKTIEARWISGDTASQTSLNLVPFHEADFDLTRPEAKTAATPRVLGEGTIAKDGLSWEFTFPPIDIRHVRVMIHEYRGEAVAINHVEIRDSQKEGVYIPTDADLLSLATNDTLEIAGGDSIIANYIDDVNLTGNSRLLAAKLTATYHNAQVTPIGYDFVRLPTGQINTIRKQVLRVEPGERVIMEVVDFDQDLTGNPDKIRVQVTVNEGTPLELEATETDTNTGIFTKEIDTTATPEEGKLTVKPGDRIFLRYLDQQNTLPGHATVRETVVYVNEPTPGRVRVFETRVVRPKSPDNNPAITVAPIIHYLSPKTETEDITAGVAFEAPFTVEVVDRDAAKDSRSKVVVKLQTTDGATVDVECILDDRVLGATGRRIPGRALQEGRFTGQVIMQLGGKDSPVLVPLTASMPRNLIGGPKMNEEDEGENTNNRGLVTKVLNITGADTVTATYTDERRPDAPAPLTATARLLTDGKLSVTDGEYQTDVTAVHVGERLFLKVVDADLDRTPERDTAKVRIRSARGEDEIVELIETLSHSGIFTGSALLKPVEKPTAGNIRPEVPEIECYFGDQLDVVYTDERASSGDGRLDSTASVLVVIGTDGKLQAFSKAFANELLAVETQFHIAESHFELFKSHQTLGREDDAKADLEAGRRVLREVMEDYPNPKYAPRVAYLLGQFAQELKQYTEAIQSYESIVKQHPDHVLAPDAQFKLAQCYEDAKQFDQALEAYVTLAATYPEHPLIANVMVRISDHFYKNETYKVAAQVGEKFLEKFEGHKWGPKMAFRVGQCYFKDKQYAKAAQAFDKFVKQFPDDQLGPDALFWAGESFRTAGNARDAFRRYNKCRWDYPASEASKYARGRLALPEMLRQFEAEATNVESENN
ncbi:MAG: tetratricopeptide repeat protein [Bacteroidales bacterium]|nr:tetratricopeptide repeat protein [Bacteroidales bacterium]